MRSECNMPAKGKSSLTPKQISAIARGKAAGKKNAEVASEAGVSVSIVDHASSNPRIGPLIVALKEKHRARLEKLYAASLEGMFGDLKHPEPDIRVRTRTQVLKFIESGEPNRLADVFQNNNAGDFSFEELLIAWRRTTTRTETG